MWVCLKCGKQFYKFRLKCKRCGGFVQTKEVCDIHVNSSCLAKRPIADSGLKLYQAVTVKEIFALVEVDCSTYADLAFVNIGDGPQGHAESHMAFCLKKMILSKDILLQPRLERPLIIRMIIKYSPCFSVCSGNLVTFQRWLDEVGREDIVLVLDFFESYLGDHGNHTTAIDNLIDAGLILPNYIAEKGIDEVQYALKQIERHFLTLQLQGSVGRDDPLLGICVGYLREAFGALGVVYEESGISSFKLGRGTHFSCAEYALFQVEEILDTLFMLPQPLGKQAIKELRDELAFIRRSVRSGVAKKLGELELNV